MNGRWRKMMRLIQILTVSLFDFLEVEEEVEF